MTEGQTEFDLEFPPITPRQAQQSSSKPYDPSLVILHSLHEVSQPSEDELMITHEDSKISYRFFRVH